MDRDESPNTAAASPQCGFCAFCALVCVCVRVCLAKKLQSHTASGTLPLTQEVLLLFLVLGLLFRTSSSWSLSQSLCIGGKVCSQVIKCHFRGLYAWDENLKSAAVKMVSPRPAQAACGSSSWSGLNGCTEPRSWTRAVEQAKGGESQTAWKNDGRRLHAEALVLTFHLRLAYCRRKFSKFTTDNLFTSACLGFRGCKDTRLALASVRQESAAQRCLHLRGGRGTKREDFDKMCDNRFYCPTWTKGGQSDK